MYKYKLHWKTYSELQEKLSEIEVDWLFDKGSLTKRLKLLSQNNFSLEVLFERMQCLREDEYTYLKISPLQKEWVREVVLKGYNQPWVYARSIIIPNHIEQQDRQSLINIGQQPLGSVLFTNKKFNRSQLEIVRYPINFLPIQYRCFNLWARRSCFISNVQRVFVQEIFLPSFWSQMKI